MNGPSILEHFGSTLTEEIACDTEFAPTPAPLPINPWTAMSLLQKAIRRGRTEWALAAGATLLLHSPDRLWRRLCVTAYEDIGVADLDVVALVTVALKGKIFRRQLGGDWAVASFLIRRMCEAAKCRTADDLMILAERTRTLERARAELAHRTFEELIALATGRSNIELRALALWFAIGTDRCPSERLPPRRGEPMAVFDLLSESGYPDTVVETAREGFRKSKEMMPPLLILLTPEWRSSARRIVEDALPSDEIVGSVPCWTYDMHVREGNQALALFLRRGSKFAKWYQRHAVNPRKTYQAGCLLFRIESGLVDRRLRWEMGDRIRKIADHCFPDLDAALAAEGRALLLDDLPLLNEARCDVVRSNL